MKNPHLRAKFAEVLEAVMPHMEPIAPGAVQPIMFQRERVFCSYRHAPQLAEALITVFVDIEFTGKIVCSKYQFRYQVVCGVKRPETALNKVIFSFIVYLPDATSHTSVTSSSHNNRLLS